MNGRDGWRLATGTLTRIPVTPPSTVDRTVAGVAMTLAPLAVVPLGLLVGLVGYGAEAAGVPALARGLLMVGALAWATRLLHLDGLSDTVDGLTASTDPQRSLEVMRSGTAGPAGVVALVVSLGIQATVFGILSATAAGAVLAGLAVVLSRVSLTLLCAHGVRAARPGGLGAAVAGSVPVVVALVTWAAVSAVFLVVASLLGTTTPGASYAVRLAPLVLVVVVGFWGRLAARRLGGITGDVLGATVECSLTVLLLCLV